MILIAICLSSMLTSYSQQVAVKDRIEEINRSMEKSFHENDMIKVASFYLDSAMISGGRMSITGRNGIDRYWMSLKDQNAQWKLETESIEDYGAFVLERGMSFLKFKTSDGAGQESNVRFFIIWKKIGDDYKILYDVFAGI